MSSATVTMLESLLAEAGQRRRHAERFETVLHRLTSLAFEVESLGCAVSIEAGDEALTLQIIVPGAAPPGVAQLVQEQTPDRGTEDPRPVPVTGEKAAGATGEGEPEPHCEPEAVANAALQDRSAPEAPAADPQEAPPAPPATFTPRPLAEHLDALPRDGWSWQQDADLLFLMAQGNIAITDLEQRFERPIAQIRARASDLTLRTDATRDEVLAGLEARAAQEDGTHG